MSDNLTEAQQSTLIHESMKKMISFAKEDIESFIQTGPLGDERPRRAVLLFNDRVYCSTLDKHAEQIALDSIGEKIEGIKNILMFINYSPCHICSSRILDIVQNHPDIKIEIKFAKVFQIQEIENRQGLKELRKHGVTLKAIEGQDWKSIVGKFLEHYGRFYWKVLLKRILDKHWESGQEKVLQEILECHQGDYKTAKMMQTFIQHWECGFKNVFSTVFLDDMEDRWKAKLEQILKDNWSDKVTLLQKICKHHGKDKWESVLFLILKHEGNHDWRTALRKIVETQLNMKAPRLRYSQNFNPNTREMIEYVNYRQVQAWERLGGILSHHLQDSKIKTLTNILRTYGQYHLGILVLNMSEENRQGYVWLKLVLKAVGIRNAAQWSGRRIIADFHAAQELDQCYQ
ncbi:uncharacterized protein LOC110990973 [Acanthaster planci]|uniref:Uncharacterized protein LOC110990973 n=1 Tax=Acanthaster planci TaxID=133434 RepID=A0A8B8A486_ACAPL|nr:uncharacterized protein LOC110990973 [Acanthaster planci]